jgi:hypothetical protein
MLWTDLIRLPAIVDWGDDPFRFVPDPVWASLYLPILVSVLVTIATSFVDLMRPWRTTLFSLVRVANAFAFAGIVVIALRARHWITVAADAAAADRAARADHWINLSIEWTLIAIMAIALFEAGYELWQLFWSRREALA